MTLKVESVKQDFIEKNAIIKSELDILTNIQSGYKNEQRLAILEFHKKFSLWMALYTNTYIPLIDESNQKAIDETLHLYEQTYHELLLSESVIEIYVENIELTGIIKDLKVSIINSLGLNLSTYLRKLSHFNEKMKHLENFNKVEDLQKWDTLRFERVELHSKYLENIIDWNEDNKNLKNNYIICVRKYLKELAQHN